MNIGRELWVVIIVALVVTGLAVGISVAYWDWLRGSTLGTPTNDLESPSTTVRNIVLGLAAVLALLVAGWRGWVADRQATIADRQATIADDQWQRERFHRSAEMLASSSMAVRLGAIYQLRQIAFENPERFHLPVMDLICAFIRTPPEQIGTPQSDGRGLFSHVPKDLAAALETFSERRREDRKAIELEAGFWLDLSGSDLQHVNLMALDLSGVLLNNADLTGAILNGSDLSGSDLHEAILINAELRDVDLRGADLSFASLFGADLSNAKFDDTCLDFAELIDNGISVIGLTQDQINKSRISTGMHPDLRGVLDAVTEQPLEWEVR